MNQEHQPHHISTYSKGANIDSEPEITFSEQGTGYYFDGRNCRPTSVDGKSGALSKINGEQLLYPDNVGTVGYKCIAAFSVNGNKIDLWAPSNLTFPGIMRINGIVVLSSVLFELRQDYPLQFDKNEDFQMGEFFITDNRVPPYEFNVKDLLDSVIANPNKYFSNFNPLLYQINLQSPLDIPVFIENINVGGGGGLPVGHYQYQMRYSSDQGDRTGWSHATPMIPIGQSLSSSSREYPWIKTFGGPPNPSSVTSFAPRLRFRVTNIYNYNYIEIKRISYNAGAGIEFTPNGVIVAKIDVFPGEISVREYIDPSESNTNIALSAEDETRELIEVERAKSLRYFDRRLVLMNVKLASKEAQLTFKEINGQQGFPVIDKIGKGGYNDPWNHVNKRSAFRGEVYGLGVCVYDGVGTKGFTTPIPQLRSYKFPDRRDVISADTANYSFDGTVKAADVTASNAVSQTHEVFDLSNPVWKNDNCNFKNIIQPGRIAGLTGTRGVPKVKEDCDETNEEIENHGTDVTANAVSCSYQPYTPIRQTDPDVTGHNYVVNTKVATDDVLGDPITGAGVPSGDCYNFRPPGFAPDYYAQGIMIAGVQNLPKWGKAFAVVRTNAAKRVLCQGIGYYALTKGKFKAITNASLGGKEQNKFWFYSEDIQSGIVSSDTMNDVIDNPQNYKLECVSPLGFFSEFYSAESNLLFSNRDRCIDMISYARLLRDLDSDPNNQVNPTEDAGMGVPGGDGFNYVAYDKYRNTGQNPNTFGGDPAKGHRLIDIAQVRRKSDGRGTFFEIETIDNIYGKASTGGGSEANFEDQGLKDWTEPLYIINIIRTGAEIRDQNIQKYKQTTHYQKLESIIGRSKGILGERFLLVDERWEDCIPAPTSSDYGASTDRYVYVKLTDGTVQKWINVTYKTTTQTNAILADIAAFGAYNTDVYGVYTHNNISGLGRQYEVIFNTTGSTPPPADSLILVRYDDTAPIRVFGFDAYVGESIFAPIDRQASAKDKAAETQFALGIGLPFKNFKINARHYTIRKAGAAVNVIQDEVWFRLGFIRQLCVMFTVESRAACHLAYNSGYPNQFFPLINYVMRPNRWDIDKNTIDNGIYQDYDDDYGGDERSQWKWGGFRFLQQINPDYSVEPRIEFFSKPEFGFIEKTEFRTRNMWSLPRAINIQDSPGLRTFPANNSFDIDDDQGEIKYAYDSTTERGENLYSICDRGVAMLVTKKSILSDLNGGNVGYMSADTFISQQLWLSKSIGSNDEMWRGISEGAVPDSEGSLSRHEALIFPNKESVFMLSGNSIIDIGRMGYYSKLFTQGLSKVTAGFTTDMCSVYDNKYQEYMLLIKGTVNNMFVFSMQTMAWTGTFDFSFDKMYTHATQTFGVRNFEVYELHKGYTINGAPIQFEVIQGVSSEQFWEKEFIRVRVNSPITQKPTRIEFSKKDGVVLCFTDPSKGILYVKNYGGWEAFIPRTDASVNVNRPLLQDRLLFYKIIHNLASEFTLINSSLQYKKLK